jgi:VWFA-related protein
VAGPAGAQSKDDAVTFRSSANLVMVPVVVRDASGRVVSDLRKEDFTLFDNGKVREIASFSVEKPGQQMAAERTAPEANGAGAGVQTAKPQGAAMTMPDHYVAYVFDDLALTEFSDLTWARDGALRYMDTLQPGDRAAVYTTSCQTWLDFTDDRAKWREAVSRLRFKPVAACGTDSDQARGAKERAQRRLYRMLSAIVKRMGILPGERSIVFVSYGVDLDDGMGDVGIGGDGTGGFPDLFDLIDQGIRARVVFNTLDARGVRPQAPGADFGLKQHGIQPTPEKTVAQQLVEYDQGQRQRDLMLRAKSNTLASGTGGAAVDSTNDAAEAFRRMATPECTYMLGFSPGSENLDGKLHRLKVTLRDPRKLSVQARNSYFAGAPAGERQAKRQGPGATMFEENEADSKEMADALGIGESEASLTAAPVVETAKTGPPGMVPPPASAPEMSSREQPVTFQSKVNLVVVPVVVRDSKGQAVGTLTKDDFELFDKGKRQRISSFSVEKSGGEAAVAKGVKPEGGQTETPAKQAATAPDNFVVYFFDDVHLKFEDLVQVRDAAGRNIDTLQPNDRAAIATTSGRNQLDFTGSRESLHAALLKLRPNALARSGVQECPDVSYYMADLIVNKDDQRALNAAAAEALACLDLPPAAGAQARNAAQAAAHRAISAGSYETRTSLMTLKDAVRRISVMPGRRNVILVSPGFFGADDLRSDELEVVERAVHFKVVISALDARGLYIVNPAGDVAQKNYTAAVTQAKAEYARSEAQAASGVLIEMTAGTGGTLVQNSNDFVGGFRRLATAPEYIYMLGFEPENLKLDGSFHALKVNLNSKEKLGVQARRGYFAPKGSQSESAAEKKAIDDAVFSREEIHELAADLHTQYLRSGDSGATLNVLASVDLKLLQFRKEEGRNRNDVTVVSSLFDNNGNFIAGWQKILQMRLREETMERLKQAPPVNFSSSFDVKPGRYLVRLVVRDAEGHQMYAANGAVEIP